jgi:hypothetical protein
MVPQGSTLINTDHFVNMTASINACDTCAQLQSVVNDSFASLNSAKAAIQAELAKLMPALSLLTLPSADPGAILSWLTNFVSFTLTPMLKPTITYGAQLTAMLAQIAQVTAAIEAAAARLTSCSITIPS